MKCKKRLGKILRLGAIVALSLAIVIALIGFTIGPAIVAKRLNPTVSPTTVAIAPAVAAFHQTLTIADLHADALLWGRNLAKLADYGHVDLPRLIQGNVALQVFTVVTQVPSPLKLEGNAEQPDNITKLAILQRWPIATWFSLNARALHQASQLKNLETQSAGKFRVIQTASDLSNYLQQRQTQPTIAAGLLGLEGAQALEGKIEYLDRLYDAGFRLIGLAHFFDNAVSGSAHGVQQIAQTGGVIGIGFWETAVCGSDVRAIVRAMRYVADRVGVDHVALGSDFDGSVRLPIDAANLVQITAALKDAGFTNAEIGQIMGLNVMRILAQVLAVNP